MQYNKKRERVVVGEMNDDKRGKKTRSHGIHAALLSSERPRLSFFLFIYIPRFRHFLSFLK